MLGGDAVCILNIVRLALQVNCIDRVGFIKYVNPIRKQIQEAYYNWNELVLSYAVGSLIWKYSKDRAESIIEAANTFLTHKESPVQVVKFK